MGKGKGGKNKRRGKKSNGLEKRELVFKDEDQEYAQVTKMLGNGRLLAKCSDNRDRLCHIRGKFRKRVWINVDDIILLGLRSFEDDKADVIHKFTADEARMLQAYDELPESWSLGGDHEAEDDDDDTLAFNNDDSSSTDIDDSEDFEQMLDAL